MMTLEEYVKKNHPEVAKTYERILNQKFEDLRVGNHVIVTRSGFGCFRGGKVLRVSQVRDNDALLEGYEESDKGHSYLLSRNTFAEDCYVFGAGEYEEFEKFTYREKIGYIRYKLGTSFGL